jgi:ankyrin repeat protein
LQQVIEDVALFLTSTTNHDDSSYSGFIHWSLPQFFQKLDSLESAVLRAAAEHGKEAAVKCLLETRGVKIDMMDMPGFAPLHKATLNGHEAVARQLIKNGANVNLPDATGHTPLSLAASKGHQAIVKLLLSTENINPNARDRQGYTALSTAVWYGDEAVVELLLATDGIDLSHTVEQISKWPIMVAKSSIGRRVGIAAAEKRF